MCIKIKLKSCLPHLTLAHTLSKVTWHYCLVHIHLLAIFFLVVSESICVPFVALSYGKRVVIIVIG